MVNEELMTELMNSHKDEMSDSEHYMTLSNKALEHGHHKAARILKDLAHEEMTHADLLEHLITGMN